MNAFKNFFALFSGAPRIRTRTDILNHLVATRGYQRYLEIGVREPSDNFDHVRVADKTSVDPAPKAPVSHKMTSDEFFAQHAQAGAAPFDLVFIDGLHLAHQVELDVENALANLTPNGAIVLHDCNPLTADAQSEDYDGKKHWNGTVWKAWFKLRATRTDLSMYVIDLDEGCGVIERGSQKLFSLPTTVWSELDYAFLVEHRREGLNLVATDVLTAESKTV